MLKPIQILALTASVLAAGLPALTAADINDPIVVGTKATFLASADGTKPITFEWYRMSGDNPPVKIGEGEQLVVDFTGPELGGTYYATASNEFSRARGDAPVISVERYIVTVGVAPSAPRIKRVLQNQTVRRGTDVRLEIEAEGALPMQFTWQHGNSLVKGENRPYVLLQDVKNKDGGFWKATARNSFGGASSDMVLTIDNRGS